MGQRKGTYSAQVFRPVMKRGELERTLVMLIYIPGFLDVFLGSTNLNKIYKRTLSLSDYAINIRFR